MNAIITAPTIMSMFMNLTTDVENNKFCYNAEMEDNRISAIEVYKNNDNVLSAHIKRIYTYDELDRLLMRETLKWNKRKQTWEKHSCLCYSYSVEGYTVEKRFWDESGNDYAEAKEYSHYTIIMNHVVAVNDYKKDNQTGDYILAQNTLVIMPDTNKLMTMK